MLVQMGAEFNGTIWKWPTRPAYGGGPYAYGGGCYIERQVVINRFGQRVIRRVRVCD
jgi:hypothetical protein